MIKANLVSGLISPKRYGVASELPVNCSKSAMMIADAIASVSGF